MPAMPTTSSSATPPPSSRAGSSSNAGTPSFGSVLQAHTAPAPQSAKPSAADKNTKDPASKKRSNADSADQQTLIQTALPIIPIPQTAPTLLPSVNIADPSTETIAADPATGTIALAAAIPAPGLAAQLAPAIASPATSDADPADTNSTGTDAASPKPLPTSNPEATPSNGLANALALHAAGSPAPSLTPAESAKLAPSADHKPAAQPAPASPNQTHPTAQPAISTNPLATTQHLVDLPRPTATPAIAPQTAASAHPAVIATNTSASAHPAVIATNTSAKNNSGDHPSGNGGAPRDNAASQNTTTPAQPAPDANFSATTIVPSAAAPTTPPPAAPAALNTPPSAAKETGSVDTSNTTAAAQPTDPTSPLGRVQVAKLLHTAAGSELRVGVQTEEFGAISIRTALGREQLSAHISVDADHLGATALSSHLSSLGQSLSDRLGETLGVRASVSVGADNSSSHREGAAREGNSNTGNTPGNPSGNSSSRQGSPSPYAVPALAGSSGTGSISPTPFAYAPTTAGPTMGRLDIRV